MLIIDRCSSKFAGGTCYISNDLSNFIGISTIKLWGIIQGIYLSSSRVDLSFHPYHMTQQVGRFLFKSLSLMIHLRGGIPSFGITPLMIVA